MASLEEPSELSTFVRQSTSLQVSAVPVSVDVQGRPAMFVCFGHAKGTTSTRSRGKAIRMLRPVGVSAVVDVEDDHAMVRVVDAVADSVLAAAGAPQPFERRAQRNPDDARSFAERPADELPGRKGRGGRKGLSERSACPRREDYGVREVIRRFSRHGARAAGVRP